MRKETLYELETPYRQKFRIKGFRFGEGEESCAMVAAVRGNEVQQMYVCALLVKKLRKLEEQIPESGFPPKKALEQGRDEVALLRSVDAGLKQAGFTVKEILSSDCWFAILCENPQ